jgi:alpha-D-ribose 1-methylphosphonate 5-triphosphate diphosphatase PhnM
VQLAHADSSPGNQQYKQLKQYNSNTHTWSSVTAVQAAEVVQQPYKHEE